MKALLIKNTLRSGKNIVHDGDVIILGCVYPSTTITAGGDIIIAGTAKGSLIAGTRTGNNATIYTGKFQCPYVRIGQFSARQENVTPTGPEYLVVENGQLVAHPVKQK